MLNTQSSETYYCHLELLRIGPRQQEFLTSVVTKEDVCERKEIE